MDAFDPGIIRSNIMGNMPGGLRFMTALFSPFMAKTSRNGVYVCSSEDIQGTSGKLYHKKQAYPLNVEPSYKEKSLHQSEHLINTIFFIGLFTLIQIPLTVMVGILPRPDWYPVFRWRHQTLLRRMRAHGNYTETVPITLLAMTAAEVALIPHWALWAGGMSLLTGRLMHTIIIVTKGWGLPRAIGMILTFIPMLGFGGLCFMVPNHMCCGSVGDTLMARVGPENHEGSLRKNLHEKWTSQLRLVHFIYWSVLLP